MAIVLESGAEVLYLSPNRVILLFFPWVTHISLTVSLYLEV